MRSLIAFLIAAAVCAVPVGQAGANLVVKVGMLTCAIESGAGYIIASRKNLACNFRGEIYDGSITKIGFDVGATGAERLVWAVFAPSSEVGTGALEGRYYGVTAQATPGIGVGANVLIGGFDRSIILQPISVTGQLGVNLAAGVAGMRLVSPPRVYKR